MAARPGRKAFRPATTPEGRENQLISQAYDLAEKRLRDGTASAQETTFFLKLGSSRERVEQQKIQNENLLLSAKVEQISSGQRLEGLLGEAISAFRQYSGNGDSPQIEEEGYYDGR